MHSILTCWVTLAFHAPLGIAAYLIAARCLSSEPGPRRWSDTFLCGFVLWRVEALLLHLTGNVDRISVLVAHGIMLAAVALLTRHRTAAGSRVESPSRHSIALGSGLLVLALTAALFRVAMLPDPYDSLTYHLMLPAHWLEHHQLDLLPTTFGDIAPTYTPEAVEVFFLGLMLPTGSDILARIGQLPFLLVAFVTLARLVPRTPAPWIPALAGLLFLAWPRVLIQGVGSMVDVAAAALFLAAFQRVFAWRESGRVEDLVFAGAMGGLFLSSRFTGLVFAPLLLLPLIPAARGQWRAWVGFAIPLLVTGSYPYLRNYFMTGNPIYPLHVSIGDWTLFPGLFTSAAPLLTPFHQGPMALLDIALRELDWSCALWIGVGLLAPLMARRDAVVRWASAAALMLMLLHIFVVPYNTNLRLAFPAWGLLVVAVVRAFSTTRRLNMILGAAVAVTLTYLFAWQLAHAHALARYFDPDPVPSWVVLGAAGAVVVGAILGWAHASAGVLRRVMVGLLCAAFPTTVGLLHEDRMANISPIAARDARYAPYVGAWQQIRNMPGRRVAYCGLNLPYPLRGAEPYKSVTTVPLDGREPGHLPHEYRRRLRKPFSPSTTTVQIEIDRIDRDRVRWKQRLRDDHIDFLAIYLPSAHRRARGNRSPIEHDWATQDRRRFRLLNPDPPLDPRSPELKLFEILREE